MRLFLVLGRCALLSRALLPGTPVQVPKEIAHMEQAATRMRGFIVFRSNTEDGSYFQLENVVKEGEFADRSVARNRTYWYRVAILRNDGSLSQLSQPRSATHP